MECVCACVYPCVEADITGALVLAPVLVSLVQRSHHEFGILLIVWKKKLTAQKAEH